MKKIRRFSINASEISMNYCFYLCITILSILCCGCTSHGKVNNVDKYFIDRDVKALAIAAANGDINKINHLVAQGVDVNARGQEDMTPLFWALINNSKVGVTALLDKGANPNFIAKNGASFVSLSAITEDQYYLKEALSHHGDPNISDPIGKKTALIQTIYYGKIRNAKTLLKNGANVNKTYEQDDDPPILTAAYVDKYDFVLLFLEYVDSNNPLTDKTIKDLLFNIDDSNLIAGTYVYACKEMAREKIMNLKKQANPTHPNK